MTASDQTAPPERLMMEYQEVCKRHQAITDFRAKLLALLPFASGTGLFLLLTKKSEPLDPTHLPALGIFGLLVTLGLFFYELRGIQHCDDLIDRAKVLEKDLGLIRGQFSGMRPARCHGLVGARGAAWIIYPAILLVWVYILAFGVYRLAHQ